jgi:hypothetical protein
MLYVTIAGCGARIGMGRKASSFANSPLLAKEATQRTARGRVITDCKRYVEHPLKLGLLSKDFSVIESRRIMASAPAHGH